MWGLICHGKLLASLLIIIYQDLALMASRRVNSFLESLCQLFTSNFRTTCVHLGVDWDLASVV
jgi:hypothetical protein